MHFCTFVLRHSQTRMPARMQIRFIIVFIPCSINLIVSGTLYATIGISVADVATASTVGQANSQHSHSGGGGFSVSGGAKVGATATLTLEVAIDIFIMKVGIGGGEINPY